MKFPKMQTRQLISWLPVVMVAVGLIVAGLLLFGPGNSGKSATVTNSLTDLSTDCPPPNQFKCYETYFTTRTNDASAKEALADLQKLYEYDTYAQSQCHQLAHAVGHAAYHKYGSLPAAYTKGDIFCWSGYYHGVTEEAVGDMGADRIKAEANNICADLNDPQQPYSFNYYNCVHGLGHGFMAVDSYQLFDALKTCDLLQGSWEQESCYGGVFMENVMVAVKNDGKTDYLKADEPLYPCTAVERAYKNQCYLMQSSYALQQNGYDFAKTFTLCRDMPDQDFATTCYQSIGRDASGNTQSDIARTKAHCETAPDNTALENCMLGAVRDFISYYHDDTKGKELCRAFGGTVEQPCLTEVSAYYSTF